MEDKTDATRSQAAVELRPDVGCQFQASSEPRVTQVHNLVVHKGRQPQVIKTVKSGEKI